MGGVVQVKNVSIGEGVPKICVSLVGKTLKELQEEAQQLRTLDIDLVEWRVDYFEKLTELEKVIGALKEIREILTDVPLIFTFRSAKEGGEQEISPADYIQLNKAIVETGLVDIIDVELFNAAATVKTLVGHAHEHHVFVILSNHDFQATPDKDELIARLKKAQELGADIPKIAVMPTKRADVLTLLDATLAMKEQFATRPIITMSMAGTGVISRLSGEIFGSAITFGAAKQASAPGQIPIRELRQILALLHKSL